MRKIAGVVKKRKTPVIVIDDGSGDGDDGYGTDDTDAGMPNIFRHKYASSDDEEDDVCP